MEKVNRPIRITDTTLRDAHQSLWATRMHIEDILPIAEKIDEVGYNSIEVWGGATFDVALRFLNEDPWERLYKIKGKIKKTPLQMLLRGQNIVGYKNYPDDLLEAFIIKAVAAGIDIFRVFDALNDVRNIEKAIKFIKREGGHAQGTVCYTRSPVHTIEMYIECAKRQVDMGIDSLNTKDMAGILTPYVAYELVSALKSEIKIPLQIHCHSSSGMAVATYLKAIEAGVDIIDCAAASLALYTSQPPVETFIAILRNTEYATGLKMEALHAISEYFEKIAEKRCLQRSRQTLIDVSVIEHQIPGGMASNLIVQLEQQNALNKFEDVLLEIPRVREELGWPPLVTPTSQIVGTQAVMNIITGKRYKVVPNEVKNYVRGYYGKSPAPIKDEIRKMIIGDEEPIKCRPADLLEPVMDKAKIELNGMGLMKKDEDVITYALFPEIALEFFRKRDKVKARGKRQEARGKSNEDKYKELSSIFKLVSSSCLSEFEWEKDGRKIKIKQSPKTPPIIHKHANQKPNTINHISEEAEKRYSEILSPMVGIFSIKPSAETKPFVEKGVIVEKGQIIGIIETMRIKNEIKAETKCRMIDIFINDSEPVEYGQPLFLVEYL
ncbi:MAG: pyruvate carboxylase subunit B [Nitrospinae bacterium RIFCSPLOWO2_02_FULL_39_110]|nr:MAG: pyruvate carboxylase subunit B [Nitrospinae bacterium RIFCSPHIGHO2_02_39_11]OGW00246.1 MAG: pyruvate carboxylase subunit B [Nitrospinae bacterium RIFCSPHIGHO2_12_FULL_39_42]OGW00407.1 MAG: pyruvate carboxylase subunit B [Nitrospinae bacterium RIFCSPHIGHO2_02_FULL_39_82]OGW03726.1 MAG: pyruvate carboxylase subunit B [Nitrospinae bacterium RIFCSPLOWO2_02_39_17]OGW04093.1 MAG: pyruvate carboxylase subunit B [Nitrospinae bacterium RIFCSPLOWO2_02_FULL_39_110]OGW08430.1 MAG: pyruvate carboxy